MRAGGAIAARPFNAPAKSLACAAQIGRGCPPAGQRQREGAQIPPAPPPRPPPSPLPHVASPPVPASLPFPSPARPRRPSPPLVPATPRAGAGTEHVVGGDDDLVDDARDDGEARDVPARVPPRHGEGGGGRDGAQGAPPAPEEGDCVAHEVLGGHPARRRRGRRVARRGGEGRGGAARTTSKSRRA